MADSINEQACVGETYLKRLPESLVLSGYRYWLHDCVFKDEQFSRLARKYYTLSLGEAAGDLALQSLSYLIQCLGVCAHCPLKFLPTRCNHLCRDECLLLGMVSGLQHGNEEVLGASLKALCDQAQEGKVVASASEYAMALKSANALLLPVPIQAIQDVLARSAKQVQHSNSVH